MDCKHENLIYDSGRFATVNDAPLISIAVRMKNEAKHLPAFLKSLELQTIIDQCELVVLDSGSTDGGLEILSGIVDRIYVIPASEFQFGRSCNQIAEKCRGKYVALFSAHVELLEQDALEQAVDLFKKTSDVAAVYFRQVTNGTLNVDFSAYEKIYLDKRFPPHGRLYKKDDTSRKLPVSNAGAIIRKDVWADIRFTEAPASEDILWARDVMDAGWRIAYLGERAIAHNHLESPEAVYRRVSINKIAQFGKNPLRAKGLILGVGIYLLLRARMRCSHREAWLYASAHARAYF